MLRLPHFLRLAAAMSLLLPVGPVQASTWQEDLDAALAAAPGRGRDALIESIARAKPEWREVAARLRGVSFPKMATGKDVVRTFRDANGNERPWFLRVPAGYDPAKPTPLLVILHGGVMRDAVGPAPEKEAQADPLTAMAEKQGWLALYPFGDKKAPWWSPAGMSNIRELLHAVKQGYNVDDDRVWMAGFSDGGSGAWLHAFTQPSEYAAFVALNGNPSVGSHSGHIPFYAPNLQNTPVYAIATTNDELYPAAQMSGEMDALRGTGAQLTFRQIEGHHDNDYVPREAPAIVDFLNAHPRNPFPARIVWEAVDKRYARDAWFQIETVRADQDPADWHKDVNPSYTDARVVFGVEVDDAFTGHGAKVTFVPDGTFAHDIGLKAGDVITGLNGTAVASLPDFLAAKGMLKRGDDVTLTVQREGKETVLKARLPKPDTFNAFVREGPSAMARATFAGNVVAVEGSRLGAFRLFISPDMVDLEKPLVVRLNGHEVYNKRAAPDVAFLINNFLQTRDRRALYVTSVKIEP